MMTRAPFRAIPRRTRELENSASNTGRARGTPSLSRQAFSRHGGVEMDTQGEGFFIAFARAQDAVAAAREAQDALAAGPVPRADRHVITRS
jgi:class 3 adenylate cyclase